MNIWWILGVGIPLIAGALITVIFQIDSARKQREYQTQIEVRFDEINGKIDTKIFMDGLSQEKEKSKRILITLALKHLAEFSYQAAIDELYKYIKEYHPKGSERCAILNLIGVSLGENKNYKEAAELFKEMSVLSARIENKAFQSIANNNLGLSLEHLGNREEALAAFKRSIYLMPDYADAWANMGVTLGRINQENDALAAFEKAIELKPNDAKAWDNKGISLWNLGKLEEAHIAFVRATELKSDYAKAWLDKSWSLLLLSRKKESLLALERAIDLDRAFIFVARTSKVFSGLWDDPDFEALTKCDAWEPINDSPKEVISNRNF